MTLWLTEQYPKVSDNHPQGVWVRLGKEEAAKDLAVKDLVFVYEVYQDEVTGRRGGAKSVIYLIEVIKLVHKDEGRFVRVANAKKIAEGKCTLDDLLKILKRKSIQSLGPLNSKLMKLNETQFDMIADYFPEYKGDLALSEEEAVDTLENFGQRQGQAYATKAVRAAIEKYSMNKAWDYFTNNGYQVEDHHKTRPYDLICKKEEKEYFVEVKGTQSKGTQLFLTPGEVRWVGNHVNKMKLFVLHSIKLSGSAKHLSASGGKELVIEPWKINNKSLTPTAYRYELGDSSRSR